MSPPRPLVPAVLIALFLSGCLAAAPGEVPEPQPVPVGPPFLAFDTGLGCASLCEPVVVSDGASIFVKGNDYGRGTPDAINGFAPPPPPVQLGPGTFQTDRHLDVDAEGRLWFSALIGNGQALGAVFSLTGVQVARSDDGGETWAVDRYLGLASTTPNDATGADRQWLAFAPDGTAWLTFQRNAPTYVLGVPTVDVGNLWIASSEDDGETWSDFEPLDDAQGSGHASGRMAFDGDVPLVPANKYDGTPGLYVYAPGQAPQMVQEVGSFFPAMAAYQDGFLFANMDADSTLQVFTWDRSNVTPLWNGTAGAMLSSPWLGVRGDSYDVVWLERTEGTEDRFDMLWSRDGAPAHTIASGLRGDWGRRVNTDFAHFTYHDDRLLVVAGDNEHDILRVYWENPQDAAASYGDDAQDRA